MSLKITGARIIDPANGLDEISDLLVEDGRVSAIGRDLAAAAESIEADGLWLIPGLVDLSARTGEPGYPNRGTMASESLAAASGGFTCIATPPDCRPVIDNAASAHHLQDRIASDAVIGIAPLGALTAALGGEQLSDMEALRRTGCAGVSNALAPIRDTHVLRCAMQYAASLGLTVHLAPVDPWLGSQGQVHEGRTATRLGLAGISPAAEVAALARDLVLVEDTGVRAHFGRLSTARAVEMIDAARQRGLPVTADVAIHQLYLTELDVTGFDARCHLTPPLRTQEDRDALRAAVASGSVDAVCSDHMPHDSDAKLAPFPETEPGMTALESALALGLRLVEEEVLSASDLISRMSSTPASILGVEGGRLAVDSPADLCLIDPDAVWTLQADALISHGKSTPFEGWEFRGRVVRTLVAGRTVYSRKTS